MPPSNSCSVKLSTSPNQSEEQIRLTYTIIKNLFHGSDQEQNMDIYILEHAAQLADKNFTIIFLHGGGF